MWRLRTREACLHLHITVLFFLFLYWRFCSMLWCLSFVVHALYRTNAFYVPWTNMMSTCIRVFSTSCGTSHPNIQMKDLAGGINKQKRKRRSQRRSSFLRTWYEQKDPYIDFRLDRSPTCTWCPGGFLLHRWVLIRWIWKCDGSKPY